MLFIIVLRLVGQSPARRPWPVRVARGRARSATIRNGTVGFLLYRIFRCAELLFARRPVFYIWRWLVSFLPLGDVILYLFPLSLPAPMPL